MKDKYYSGLPQILWDNIMCKAEDLLVDECLGNHIVGMYPAGERIYGIESSSESIICLYIDTAESILDPASINYTQFNDFSIENSNSRIIMIELHNWIRKILKIYSYESYEEYDQDTFFDLIPCYFDILFQDECIERLISLLQELLLSRKDVIYRGSFLKNYIEQPLVEALYHRTIYIWRKYSKFIPNINKEYGEVFSIKNDFNDLFNDYENRIISCAQTNKQICPEIIKSYDQMLIKKIDELPFERNFKNHERLNSEIRKETIDLYKKIL